MKKSIIFLVIGLAFASKGQVEELDSLHRAYRAEPLEERKIDILNQLSFLYNKVSLDKSEEVALEALERASALHYQKGIGDSYNNLGIDYSIGGKYDKGLEFFLKALTIREKEKDVDGSARVLNNVAGIYMYQKDYRKALEYSGKSLELVRIQKDKLAIGNALLAHGLIYEYKKDTSKAFSFLKQSLSLFKEIKNKSKEGEVLIEISKLLEENQKHHMALDACFRAMDLMDIQSDYAGGVELYQAIGQIYSGLGNEKTALHYFHLALQLADKRKAIQAQMSSRLKLSQLFQKLHAYDSALYYHQAYARLSEERYSKDMTGQAAMREKVYESEKKDQLLELNNQKVELQKWIILGISVVLLLSTITGFILYRYYRQKKDANIQLSILNKLISERNEEITAQSKELIEANEEIGRINENLEEEVNFRTEKIRVQNEKLLDYAYFNAHKVRGPLARSPC